MTTVHQTTAPTPSLAMDPSPGGRQAEKLLADAQTTISPALRAAVDSLDGEIGELSRYHFGWADPAGRSVPGAGAWGKGLRSALTLSSARAVGGAAAAAQPAATAVELVHNASLIQDDLIDADTVRRHRPAVWALHGLPAAVLVGDALFHAAINALHTGPGHLAGEATLRLNHAVQELITGELADTRFEQRRDTDIGVDEVLQMSEAKTGALIGAACALGAWYGGADRQRCDQLDQFGRRLGLAFQAVDDALGIWGLSTETGKPVLADLSRRKRSLPVVYALASDTAAARELGELYRGTEQLTTCDAERAAELVEAAGARAWIQDFARQQIAAAHQSLVDADVTAGGRSELTALAQLICDRHS